MNEQFILIYEQKFLVSADAIKAFRKERERERRKSFHYDVMKKNN